MKMRPSRSTVTTSPDFGSSGFASARGKRTSTPPCMIGAVIMKMISSTNATSTSDVTLMSAFKGSSPCPRSPPPPPPRSPAIRASLRAPHPQRLELRRGKRGLGRNRRAVVLQTTGLQLGEEIDPLAQQAVVGRGGQPHRRVVGIVEPRRALDLRHEAVGLPPHAPELPPLEEDEIPGDDRKHDEDGEDEFGLAARRENQLPGRCGDRPAHLKEHDVSPP